MAVSGLLLVSESIQTIFNGATLGVGYKVYTYEAGTSTPLATYPHAGRWRRSNQRQRQSRCSRCQRQGCDVGIGNDGV